MKKFGLFLASIIILIAFSITANAAGQKILIESFTATWCGPCGANGKPATAQILETYPDDVFVTELHASDAYSIPEEQTLAGAFGITGIPAGLLNRNPFNSGGTTVWGLYPTNWIQVIPQMLTATPVVEVKAFYSISGSQLTVTVEAEFLTAVNVPGGELHFNVYVNENHIAAAQNGISGIYDHKNICRAMLGGAWGTAGIMPNSVSKGQTYTHTYNYTLNSAWKVDDLEIFAVVNEFHTGDGNYVQILNAAKGMEGAPYSEVTVSGTTVSTKLTGDAYEKVFKLKNISDGEVLFKIELNKSARTPADWVAELVLPSTIQKFEKIDASTYEVKLDQNQTADLTIKLTPNSIGAGDADILIYNKYDSKGQKSRGSITCISKEITNLQVTDFEESADEAYTIKNQMATAGLNNVVDITASEFESVGTTLNDLTTLVWNSGEKGSISASEASDINSAINDGVNTFILGGNPHTLKDNASSLLNNLGIQYSNVCRQGSTTGKINLVGYAGDAISDKFDQSCTLINFLTPAFKSLDASTTPILKHKSVDTIVAMRSVVNDTRVILLGINPYIITSVNARNTFLNNCISWLAGAGPSIECQSTASFENTEVGMKSEQTITIENKGKADLEVENVEIEYDYSLDFKVKGNSSFVVPSLGTYDLIIEFGPRSAMKYNTWVKIKSNAENDPEKQITLTGTGIKASTGPVATLNKQSIEFTETNVDETSEQTFEISNTGNEALTVTNITVPGAYSNVFVIDPTSFSIAVNKKQEVKVTFNPSEEGTFATNMTIVSNAKNSPTTLPISAEAVVGVDDFTVKSEIISLVAGPNPFASQTKIELILNGTINRTIEISMIDANGQTVKSIENGTFIPGSYNFDLNANELASGTYFVVAKTKDFTTQIPVVIVK